MSGGGSDTPTTSAYSVDKGKLAEFMNTQLGRQYAASYDPNASYMKTGNTYSFYKPNKTYGAPGGPEMTSGPVVSSGSATQGDATQMMNDYNTWLMGDVQAKQTWDNYAKAVAANKGGEGDNTITSGAAMGQRQAILGQLANPNDTTPTPGLGVTGATSKKLGAGK